jgi:hypothetical protein
MELKAITVALACCCVFAAATAFAQTDDGLFEHWQDRASQTQAEQPHWVTPVVTVTPRLEQEIRYDLSWRTQPDATSFANYGGGKGLELIPSSRTELIIGIPGYIVHGNSAHDGVGDESFLLKYRVLSANEEHGSYILTLFLGATVPTGSYRNGANDAVVTPTVAFGKGWGHFDVQSTFGVSIPTADALHFGHPVLSNTALQYRLFKKLWPEIEVNATFFHDGNNDGKKQVFLTPGLILGRFPIHNRLGFTLGGGVQIAVTRFHQFDHNWILSLRMPF